MLSPAWLDLGNLAGGFGGNEGPADEAVIGWDVLTLMETPPTVHKEEGLASLSRQSLSGSSCPGEREEAMVSRFCTHRPVFPKPLG